MNRNVSSDCELLKLVSSGVVSKGLYLQNDLNDSISPRYHLVDIPDDVQFSLPSFPETVETFELFNQKVSEQFGSVLNNGGRSLAVKFLLAIKNFFSKKKKDIKKLKGSDDPFFDKWSRKELLTTAFVPTASVQIENTKRCKLSTQALLKLQKLEIYFRNSGFDNEFLNLSEKFFIEFGSHYFIGTYHLGGLRKDTRTEKVIEKKAHEKKYDSFSSLDIKYDKYGGSPPEDDICNWKRSLVNNRSYWCVIDKEESSAMNYRAVWRLIDSANFRMQYEFSDALEKAWKKLTGLSIDPEIDGTALILENQMKYIEEEIEKDIFLFDCTENLSIQTGMETTVQEMLVHVKNNYPFNTWTPGGLEIENTEQKIQRIEKELKMVISRLYDEYMVEIDKTGDVEDSVCKVLKSENLKNIYLTSEQYSEEVGETQMFSSAQVRLHQS